MPIPAPKISPAEPVPFQEAIEWFGQQAPWISGSSWDTMASLAAMKGDQVSSATLLSVLDDVWGQIDRAVAEGKPYGDFLRDVAKDLDSKWYKVDSPRMKLIYHNNVGNALMAGRYAQLEDPDVMEARPWLLFDGIGDFRQCFAAGTLVRMADGSERAIETVFPGDAILSCRGVSREVVATIVAPKTRWGEITLSTGKSLIVTPNHPILTRDGWTFATSITAGCEVITYNDSDNGTAKLSRLWRGLPTIKPREQVLFPPMFQTDTPAPMQTLRLDVQTGGENGTQEFLQRGVQETPHRSLRTDMQGMRQGFHTNAFRSTLVLFGGVPETGPRMSIMQQNVQPEAQPDNEGNVLLGPLPDRSQTGWDPDTARSTPMCEVWHRCTGEPIAGAHCKDHILLSTVQVQPRNVQLPSLWRAEDGWGHSRGKAVLLDSMLPEVSRRDVTRDGGTSGAGCLGNRLSARAARRALVSRLPSRRQCRARSRWELLARKGKRAGARQPQGRSIGEDGLRCYSTIRICCQREPRLRQRCLGELWPYPSDAIRTTASAATVVGVRWFTASMPEPAYDLQVADDKGFIANGVVVHNSNICAARDGVILPADDLWWKTNRPLLHHHAVVSDSMVAMDGGTRRIRDIRPGDRVLTHRGRYRRVTTVLHKLVRLQVRTLHLAAGGSLNVTNEHPILRAGADRFVWQRADELKIGDELLQDSKQMSGPKRIGIGNPDDTPSLLHQPCITLQIPGDCFPPGVPFPIGLDGGLRLDMSDVENVRTHAVLSDEPLPENAEQVVLLWGELLAKGVGTGCRSLNLDVEAIHGVANLHADLMGLGMLRGVGSLAPHVMRGAGPLCDNIRQPGTDGGLLDPCPHSDAILDTPAGQPAVGPIVFPLQVSEASHVAEMLGFNQSLTDAPVADVWCGFHRSRISTIDVEVKLVQVSDLTVEEDESYVADGVVVHNCRSGVVSLDEADAKELGGRTKAAKLQGIEPAQEGWGKPASWIDWKPKADDYHRSLADEYERWTAGKEYTHDKDAWDLKWQAWAEALKQE